VRKTETARRTHKAPQKNAGLQPDLNVEKTAESRREDALNPPRNQLYECYAPTREMDRSALF
jgi:hypothetical protein